MKTFKTLSTAALLMSALFTAGAQAAAAAEISEIAVQGNRALQQIRLEAVQALPQRLRGEIALPPRAQAAAAQPAPLACADDEASVRQALAVTGVPCRALADS